MKIAVVILNWNGKQFLQQFLPSVIQHSPDYAEIYVADNASTDDSVAFVKEQFPAVKIIVLPQNGGFAKGYNDALKQITADYFILLNSDVEVSDNWIAPVIGTMERDPLIAACQPKIRSFHQKDYFEYAGAAGGFIDHYAYPFCRGRMFDTTEKDEGQYDDTREIFWATGACLFIKAELYHQLGGLDEDFFAHMEEIDLCWRLKNAGYKIYYCGQSTVFHVGGGALPKSNPHKTYLNFRNNLFLIYKNYNSHGLTKTLLMRMILDGIAGIKFLFSGEPGNFMAVLKAHYSYYKAIPTLKRKRKNLNQEVKQYTSFPIYQKTIITEHFLKHKSKFSELDQNAFNAPAH